MGATMMTGDALNKTASIGAFSFFFLRPAREVIFSFFQSVSDEQLNLAVDTGVEATDVLVGCFETN